MSSGEPRSATWFAEEVHVHEVALKSFLRQSYPDARQEVDDVVQESYLRVWRAAAQHRLTSAKAFLFTVARHVTLDFLRRRHTSPILRLGDLHGLPVIADARDIADVVGIDEKVRMLVQGLATLPPRAREVVMLRKFQGLSQKETAVRLRIAEKTVDEHLHRGMKRLGDYLRARGICSYYDP